MEDLTFDRKKVIEEMEALKSKVIEFIEEDIKERGKTEADKEDLAKLVTVKYLGKIGLQNEKGEIIDKDWYAIIDRYSGQITYYAENQIYLGQQQGIDGKIQSVWEVPKEMKDLKKEDIEAAKTLEQLEEEQKQEDQEKGDEEKEEEPGQQLPGLEEGPQLSREQVNRLEGPKIDLNQQVDNVTLARKLDIDGAYIKFVPADDPIIKQISPEVDLSALGQKFVPLQIFANGTANVIGEEKLAFSTIEGSNCTKEQSTMNDDGRRTKEQGIETFNIPGTNNCLTIGWDEGDVTSPFYEAKFGTRVPDKPEEVAYDELHTVHEGEIKSDSELEGERRKNTEGIYEPDQEPVTDEQATRYANTIGLFLPDSRIPDIEKARKILGELSRGSNQTVETIIQEAEEDVMQLGPSEDPRRGRA